MTERTPLTTYRNSDLRVVYQFPQDTDLTDMVPSFFYRLEAGATPLLTVTNIPTPNGSSAVIIGTAVVVTLKIDDIGVFPAVDVWAGVYDSVLTKNGFVNKFVGGPLTQYVDGSYGDELFGDTVIVSVDGTEIPIIIEGGNLGAAVGVGLAALNAAVAAAEESAMEAQDAAAAAAEAAASVPSMLAGKLNINGVGATSDILENLPYTQTGTGAVARSQKSKNDDVLNARDFGVVADGVTDDSAAMALAVADAIASGRDLELPSGVILMTVGLNAVLSNYMPAPSAAFAPGLTIRGQGIGRTVIQWQGASDWWLDTSAGAAFKFGIGGELSGFTLRQSGTVTASSGIRLRSTVSFTAKDIHIIGLSGDGFDDACLAGDADGNVQLYKENIRVENCKGWGWNGAAAEGYNENSALNSRAMFVQNCGTAEQTVITGISKANPAVVTSANHGRANGDVVYIAGVQGMPEINTGNSEQAYIVTGATTNTFQLTGVNSTTYGTYTSGGHVVSARPKSGGVKLKGQISRHDQLFLTINKNVSLYVEEGPATAQGLDLSGIVVENPQMCGIIIAGVVGFRSSMGQSYANAAQAGDQCYFGCMFDGVNDPVTQVDISNHTVRITSDNLDYVQWAMCGSNVDYNTINIRDTNWKQFGASRQKKFTPTLQFQTVVDGTHLVVVNSSSAIIAPSGEANGNRIPVRLGATGEYIGRHVAAIPVAPVGGAAATYNVYTYDDNNITRAELSTTGYVTDSRGYRVKSDDPTRLFKGRVRTNGSGGFETTNLGWLNPTLLPGGVTGTDAWGWFSTATRQFYIRDNPGMPAFQDDATYAYANTTEALISPNVVVTVPAGPGGVFTATITGVSIQPGDYVLDVQTTAGLGTFVARGTCNTNSEVNIVIFDPAQVGGSLNGGTAVRIQCIVRRR